MYWVRRILVLGILLLVVTGVGFGLNALTGGGQNKAKDTVSPASAKSTAPSPGASVVKVKKKKRATTPEASPNLATPEGLCDPADIAVSPFVTQAAAWRPTPLVLELKTRRTEACYFTVSARAVTVAVTNRLGEVWTSRQCPASVPSQQLVLRNDVGVKVSVTWSGRRSDDGCSRTTRWASPGWYRLEAAAFGGEPGQLLFQLKRPADVPAESSPSATGATTASPGEGQPTDYVAESGAPEPNG